MQINIDHQLNIAPFEWEDAYELTKRFSEATVLEQLLDVPHPYTLQNANDWISSNLQHFKKTGEHLNLAIKVNQMLIGGIGRKMSSGNFSHSTEIGYWLSSEFWGLGLATKSVSAYVEWLTSHHGFVRVTAIPFSRNTASCRVLEKSGFKLEGILNKFVLKNGEFIDCKLYAYCI